MLPEEKRENEKTQILEAAAKCFAANGIDEMNFETVADEVGIDAEIVSDIFGDKNELIYETLALIIDGSIDNLKKLTESVVYSQMNGMQQVEYIIRALSDVLLQNHGIVTVINEISNMSFRNGAGKRFMDDYMRYAHSLERVIKHSIEKGVDDKSMRGAIDAESAARFITNELRIRLHGMECVYMSDDNYFDLEEDISKYVDMLIKGLSNYQVLNQIEGVFEKRKMIVVIDTENDYKSYEEILKERYDVNYAGNCTEAMDVLEKHKEYVSAIILDADMAEKDEYEIFDELKKDIELAQVPVLAMMNKEDVQMEESILMHGAVDYMLKSYSQDIMIRRLQNMISMREAEAKVNVLKSDILTGLYNKEAFYKIAEEVFAEKAKEEQDIVAIDIEKFKLINDNFGMQEGDKLLKYIAERITVYTKDVKSIAMRSTADNFYILMEHKNGFPEQLAALISSDLRRYKLNLNISVKCGIYKVDDKTLPVANMCDRALLASRMIKGKYDILYSYYDDSIRVDMQFEQTITNEMEKALFDKQFEVYFQPKYDLLTDKIAGAEALVRWNHPERGLMPPSLFIPIFEKNGFISKLDMYVWDKTCQYISEWKNKYNVSIPVSVNVSRCDIYNINLVTEMLNIVGRYGLKPSELHLEITETAYTEDSKQLIDVIAQLKQKGFTIEMDDFGSGYSSLNMISELPIDILKLDMRFVQNGNINSNKNIMNFVIGLAKWMNLLVVAEGVETQEQINILKSMECNYVQGYFYSKPIPADEFSNQLKNAEISPMVNESEINLTDGKVNIKKGGSDRIILVVDSMRWNGDLVYEYFKNSYSIASTASGSVAWEYIEDNADKIVMIISDLVLSGMSGMELLIKLKAQKEYVNIPIITTAQLGQGGEEMALSLGASDFIQKPYSKGVMIRRVQNVLVRNSIKMGRELENDADQHKIDPATGLLDKDDAATQIFAYISKEENSKATFMLLDIDNFKQVNDKYGHSEGNKVIKKMVEILKKSFRKDEIMCHTNGDEFAIFLPEEIKEEVLINRAENLCQKMQFKLHDIDVTCSIGICNYPDNGQNYQMLYQNAKIALMEAKASGKKQYKIFQDKI